MNKKEIKLPVNYSVLTFAERRLVRERYIELQSRSCYWCGHSLDKDPPTEITDQFINWSLFPPNFLKYPIHLQHCHETDMTEGAVHAYCNAVMWQYHGR